MDGAVKELDRIFAREGRMVGAIVLDHTTQLVEHMQSQATGAFYFPSSIIVCSTNSCYAQAPLPPSKPPTEVKRCPPPTPLFTGRVEVLAQMRRFFFDKSLKRHAFVLHGLGGAGKTQIACRFVDDVMDDPTHESAEIFLNSFDCLADRLCNAGFLPFSS